jgi:hypothetical protein
MAARGGAARGHANAAEIALQSISALRAFAGIEAGGVGACDRSEPSRALQLNTDGQALANAQSRTSGSAKLPEWNRGLIRHVRA